MRSIFEKNKALNSINSQILIIIIAFLVIGIASFFFVYNIENTHLNKDIENFLTFVETELILDFMEYESVLFNYSEIIRDKLLKGENEDSLSAFLISTTDFILDDRVYMSGFRTLHGYFFNFGGKHLFGRSLASHNEDFIPEESLWYQSAINARGGITLRGPYKDILTGNNIFTFSKYLTDNNGEPLAVICLDIDMYILLKYTAVNNLTTNSYGIILNDNLNILAHQDRYIVGTRLNHIKHDISYISYELEAGNYNKMYRIGSVFNRSVASFKKIKHDWFLGIVVPLNEYYSHLVGMALFLFILCSLLAWGLCAMLYSISKAKLKSDLRTQQKSNFLATMSHEIRTPLNAILGMTEIQLQNASHPPASSEAFIKINNSGKLLLNIINDILDLSRIESGKLELTPVKYEVASLINDIIQLNYIRYDSKPIEFKIEVDENVPAVLVGDELRIKQILNNLLSNAFKYTDNGEVTFSVGAECIGRGGGVIVTLIFEIKDTGQGMTQEQIKKLFDEYTRFNMEANRTTEGAGLGMTITRNLIDLMYGKIEVKSKVGEGTTINIRLPQKTDGIGIRGVLGKEMAENLQKYRLDNAVPYKKTRITHEYMPYGHILIVDDVETNLHVAKGLMTSYGLKIDLASSGFEAIDKVNETGTYDIIFMDHMMPKMDGIETTKKIRDMGYTQPIVALTANAIAGQSDMFLKNGFDDFISKPIDIRLLNVLLNRLIRDKQPIEVIDAAHKEKAEMEKKTGSGHEQVDSQLAQIFARDAERAINIIEACIKNNLNDDNDSHMYIINIHAMKSALANIGENELSITASRLEQAGRDKNFNVIISETTGFLDKLNKVVNEIKLRDKDKDNVEDTKDALVFLDEKLKIIKGACSAYDKKTAKNALGELREKTWSLNTKELINSIAEHLLHSEFDETLALVDKYIK